MFPAKTGRSLRASTVGRMPLVELSHTDSAILQRHPDAQRQNSLEPTTSLPSTSTLQAHPPGAVLEQLAQHALDHGSTHNESDTKEKKRARERLRSMRTWQAEVPLPTLCCDARPQPAWRHTWEQCVDYTFDTVEEFGDSCMNSSAETAGLALSYLCRYLTLSEDKPHVGGGGGTAGWPLGAAASVDEHHMTIATLSAISIAFKQLDTKVPSFELMWLGRGAGHISPAMHQAIELEFVQTLQVCTRRPRHPRLPCRARRARHTCRARRAHRARRARCAPLFTLPTAPAAVAAAPLLPHAAHGPGGAGAGPGPLHARLRAAPAHARGAQPVPDRCALHCLRHCPRPRPHRCRGRPVRDELARANALAGGRAARGRGREGGVGDAGPGDPGTLESLWGAACADALPWSRCGRWPLAHGRWPLAYGWRLARFDLARFSPPRTHEWRSSL